MKMETNNDKTNSETNCEPNSYNLNNSNNNNSTGLENTDGADIPSFSFP